LRLLIVAVVAFQLIAECGSNFRYRLKLTGVFAMRMLDEFALRNGGGLEVRTAGGIHANTQSVYQQPNR